MRQGSGDEEAGVFEEKKRTLSSWKCSSEKESATVI